MATEHCVWDVLDPGYGLSRSDKFHNVRKR